MGKDRGRKERGKRRKKDEKKGKRKEKEERKRLAVKARGAPGRRGRVSTAIGRSPRPLAWATVVDPKRNGFKCKPAT